MGLAGVQAALCGDVTMCLCGSVALWLLCGFVAHYLAARLCVPCEKNFSLDTGTKKKLSESGRRERPLVRREDDLLLVSSNPISLSLEGQDHSSRAEELCTNILLIIDVAH